MKMLKMFALGIVAGLAAVSAKAQCDGPVIVPGLTAGSCNCASYQSQDYTPDTGACTPSASVIGHRDDYTTCGGDGYTSCTTTYQTVGYTYTGCITTPDFGKYSTLLIGFDDCVNNDLQHGGGPCRLNWCDWNTCTMGTGGTPINADVETSLGDDCGG